MTHSDVTLAGRGYAHTWLLDGELRAGLDAARFVLCEALVHAAIIGDQPQNLQAPPTVPNLP